MSQEALQSSVLVLNRSFVPLHLVTAQRAFGLLFKAVAEVVTLEDGQLELYNFETWQEVSAFKKQAGALDGDSEWISTIRFELQVPRVIRLQLYNNYPRRRVSFNRRNIFARDENRCQYCGRKYPTNELSLDHVVPLSRGGLTCWANIVCACTRCNARKGGRLPREASMKLIQTPYEPKSNPAFQVKIASPRYPSWKHFVDEAYWSVPLKD